MEALFWIGRILLGGFFILNGLNHFTQARQMVPYAQSKKVPFPALAVYVTGLMLLLGGLAILTGLYVQVGLWLLVVFLLFVTPWMHNFWSIPDPMQRMGEMVNFMKNLALLGAVLMLLYLWSA
ncbi:DoxX family membrane protein [Meiothermus rufus]|uniref:DoxX family membrane protein n=1 Tax=Meiothermus rufus TaxID=604332 RepID=UPI0004019387|nr:DoxX family membrane protein [Meiothermus rufus]